MRSLIYIIVLLALGGCTVVSKYYVSSATLESDEFRINKIGKIKIDHTVVVIRPTNSLQFFHGGEILWISDNQLYVEPHYTYTYYEDFVRSRKPSEYFILEILVMVENDSVIFHPGKTILRVGSQDNDAFSYYELDNRYSDTIFGIPYVFHMHYHTSVCKGIGDKPSNPENPLRLARERAADQPLRLEQDRDSCFAIKFKVPPPDPRTSFSIKINGLIINDKPVSLPSIKFKPEIYTEKRSN